MTKRPTVKKDTGTDNLQAARVQRDGEPVAPRRVEKGAAERCPGAVT